MVKLIQNDVPRSWLVTRRGCFRVDLYLFLQCCVNVFCSSGCRRSFRVTGAFSCPFLPELGPSGPKPISSSLWDWVTLLLSKEWEKDLLGQKYMNTTYQMGIKCKVNIKTEWRTKKVQESLLSGLTWSDLCTQASTTHVFFRICNLVSHTNNRKY